DRIGHDSYEGWVATGSAEREVVVEETLAEFERGTPGVTGERAVRLTKHQEAIVHDLAKGLDIPAISRKRGRTQSATYEMVGRIVERFGVETWEQIVPAAIEHGFLD